MESGNRAPTPSSRVRADVARAWHSAEPVTVGAAAAAPPPTDVMAALHTPGPASGIIAEVQAR